MKNATFLSRAREQAVAFRRSGPGQPAETHFGLVPKRLVHTKSMRALAHITESSR
jgi:hypothetical protein